jgi:hypothetical protein
MTRWIEGASFEPEAVRAMGMAFDQVWAEIAGNFGDPSEVETARLRLAEAILSIATNGCTDVGKLKAGALHAMAQYYRSSFRPQRRGIPPRSRWRSEADGAYETPCSIPRRSKELDRGFQS